ncbi:hypothetical protein DL768_003535 [Monosporascus sp. mg162]|nr:hypothetical protein DL768_003535 [Monosporascus sp. mg162]
MPTTRGRAQRDDGATPDITVFRGWGDPEDTSGRRTGSLKEAPKGKIPYVECRSPPASTGEEIWVEANVRLSDSTLIIKALSGWGVVPDLNAVLGPEDRAKGLALRALLEEKLELEASLSPAGKTWERWMQNYYVMRDHVLRDASYPVRVIVGLLIYRKTTATLHGQGTGRFAPEEIAMFRLEIWEAFSDLLRASKEKMRKIAGEDRDPFWVLCGDDPTEADCVLFGFIVSVLICKACGVDDFMLGTDSQNVIRDFPILLEQTSSSSVVKENDSRTSGDVGWTQMGTGSVVAQRVNVNTDLRIPGNGMAVHYERTTTLSLRCQMSPKRIGRRRRHPQRLIDAGTQILAARELLSCESPGLQANARQGDKPAMIKKNVPEVVEADNPVAFGIEGIRNEGIQITLRMPVFSHVVTDHRLHQSSGPLMVGPGQKLVYKPDDVKA